MLFICSAFHLLCFLFCRLMNLYCSSLYTIFVTRYFTQGQLYRTAFVVSIEYEDLDIECYCYCCCLCSVFCVLCSGAYNFPKFGCSMLVRSKFNKHLMPLWFISRYHNHKYRGWMLASSLVLTIWFQEQ